MRHLGHNTLTEIRCGGVVDETVSCVMGRNSRYSKCRGDRCYRKGWLQAESWGLPTWRMFLRHSWKCDLTATASDAMALQLWLLRLSVQWALPCPGEVSEISWPAINWELSVKNAVVWRLGKKSPLEALLPVHRQVVQAPRLRWLQVVPGLLYARGWGFRAPSQPTGPACDCAL